MCVHMCTCNHNPVIKNGSHSASYLMTFLNSKIHAFSQLIVFKWTPFFNCLYFPERAIFILKIISIWINFCSYYDQFNILNLYISPDFCIYTFNKYYKIWHYIFIYILIYVNHFTRKNVLKENVLINRYALFNVG